MSGLKSRARLSKPALKGLWHLAEPASRPLAGRAWRLAASESSLGGRLSSVAPLLRQGLEVAADCRQLFVAAEAVAVAVVGTVGFGLVEAGRSRMRLDSQDHTQGIQLEAARQCTDVVVAEDQC